MFTAVEGSSRDIERLEQRVFIVAAKLFWSVLLTATSNSSDPLDVERETSWIHTLWSDRVFWCDEETTILGDCGGLTIG